MTNFQITIDGRVRTAVNRRGPVEGGAVQGTGEASCQCSAFGLAVWPA